MTTHAVKLVSLRVEFADKRRKLYVDHRFQRDFTTHELVADGVKVTLYLCKPVSRRKGHAVLWRDGSTCVLFELNERGIACAKRSKQEIVKWMLRRLHVSA